MPKTKIILSTDSSCDLSKTFSQRYNISYCPFNINLVDQQYKDGVDIFPDDIYKMYYESKVLPKTSAISVGEYKEYFENLKKVGHNILHINLSSGLSSTYRNCVIASREIENIYPVDSYNLSTGIGILVIKAAKMIEEGLEVKDIQQRLSLMAKRLRASFVIDTLEFLKAGGRCSAIVSMGASLLSIKPRIEVNDEGKLVLGKKYRGSLEKVLSKYTDNILESIDTIEREQIFITHSGIDQKYIDMVRGKLESTNYFENIYEQRAGCTISSHCGPNTLGLIYLSNNFS